MEKFQYNHSRKKSNILICILKQSIFLFTINLISISMNAQDNYFEAFSRLEGQLSGKEKLDFQKAVYITENAFFDNQLDREVFDSYIDFYIKICKQIMKSGEILYLEKDKEIASAQCAVFLFITDTVPVTTIGDDVIGSIPFTYNFDDYAGKKDWSNMFVSTLMETNSGNCHSMPYLYKILMDKLGYESNLALAPNHIYIKAQNKKVGWYNIELTCADFPTDVWYAASGYIHTDAIRNGIYMKALSEKESVALCMIDLAQGYQAKFGIEDGSFILKCCDTALSFFPKYINALLMKAETLTALHKTTSPDSEESKNLLLKMNELYTMIHKLGYRKMPQGMYLNWLKRMEKESINDKMKSIIIDKNVLK